MRFPGFDKTPPCSEFGCPEPDKDLSKIWYISEPGNPDKPLFINLPGIGEFWVCGWIAPVRSFGKTRPSIKLFYNGQEIPTVEDELIPPNAFELFGCVSCISSNLKRHLSAKSEEEIVVRTLSAQVDTIFNNWLTGIDQVEFDRVLRPIIVESPRLRKLIIEVKSPQYIKLVYQFHKFKTNKGEKTLQELLSESTTAGIEVILATASLPPDHFIFKLDPSIGILADLRESKDRDLIAPVIEYKEIKFKYVEQNLREFIKEKDSLSTEERILKEWFEKGFKKSPWHKKISVAILSPEYDGDLVAAIIPSEDPRSSRDYDCAWVETSILILNPKEELEQEVLHLPPSSKLYKHIPIAVHNTASLFALGTFAEGFEESQWENITNLLIMVNRGEPENVEVEKRIDELVNIRIDTINENLGDKMTAGFEKVNSVLQKVVFDSELSRTQEKLDKAEQKIERYKKQIQTYRNILGLDSQFKDKHKEAN